MDELGNYTLIANGDFANDTDCKYGNCYFFQNRTEYLNAGNGTQLNVLQNFTISVLDKMLHGRVYSSFQAPLGFGNIKWVGILHGSN